MTVDFLFVARNRLAFTQECLFQIQRNTNWSLVKNFVVYDDGSTDGTLEYLQEQAQLMGAELRQTRLGSPVTITNHFVTNLPPDPADFMVKMDNDAMCPPRWLDVALDVMTRHPKLHILGLEERRLNGPLPHTYQPAVELDGLYAARAEIFRGSDLPVTVDRYWGWSTWIRRHGLKCGWLKPSLPVFLLDRVPVDPWLSHSHEYEQKGWQRPTAQFRYKPTDSHLWSWCYWS